MDWSRVLVFLKDFFYDQQFFVLLNSTLILFVAVYILWYFYHKQLAKRDLFETPQIESDSKFASFVNRVMYFLKYLVVFPLYSFVWFLIFTFLLVLIAKTSPIEDIMFFGIIVVSVTRIAAYVSYKLAEDMAKLLPWALIIFFLTDPASITPETLMQSFNKFIDAIPKVAKYLLFITFIEWVLRIGNWILGARKR